LTHRAALALIRRPIGHCSSLLNIAIIIRSLPHTRISISDRWSTTADRALPLAVDHRSLTIDRQSSIIALSIILSWEAGD
jgi:hypothetical protein